MDKDPNKNLDPNKPTPKPNDGGNAGKDKNSFQISKDDWNKTQTTIQHLTNTAHNLGKRLENANKSNTNPKPNTDPSHNDKKFVSRDEFNKLVQDNKKLSQSVQHKNHHADVLQHAKDTLKMNHMKVSPTTFNQLLGADNRTTDAKINWFKGIYKKINSRRPHFPPANHHNSGKTTIGTQLAKDEKNGGAMCNIKDCFDN